MLSWKLTQGKKVKLGSEYPSLQIDGLLAGPGWRMQKMPRLLVFARHMEMAIVEAQKPRSMTLMRSRTLFATTGTLDLEKNPPCNAEDNLRAGLIVIEAWFGGY